MLLVKEYILSSKSTGIDIIELGYISDDVTKGTFKDLRNLDDETNDYLINSNIEYSFMLDYKEIASKNVKELDDFLNTIPCQVYSLCRIASPPDDFEKCLLIAQKIKSKLRINVAINLMYSSTIHVQRLKDICKKASNKIYSLYLADSYGSMMPEEVNKKLSIMKKFNFMTGVHFHDNLGLAFANSLVAMKLGVDFIDSTISGMGRGVGNLKTEQIVSYLDLKLKNKNYTIKNIIDITAKFNLIRQKYNWGWSIDYMASGCLDVHQKEVINMKMKNCNTHSIINKLLKEQK
jgi:4-hydroxy 2-oxovalerate aldolase